MNQTRHFVVACTFALCAVAATVQAAPRTPSLGNDTLNLKSPSARYSPQRPAISPYLAITQNSNLTFINYFTITQPLFAQRQASRQQSSDIQQLENQVQFEQQEIDAMTGQRAIGSTGHRAGFMTQGTYFIGGNKGNTAGAAAKR